MVSVILFVNFDIEIVFARIDYSSSLPFNIGWYLSNDKTSHFIFSKVINQGKVHIFK